MCPAAMEKQRGFLVTETIQQAQKLKVCPEVSLTDETFSIATNQENQHDLGVE